MQQPLLYTIENLLGEGALNHIHQLGYADLTVTFVDEDVAEEDVADDQKKLLENVPVVRVTITPTGK